MLFNNNKYKALYDIMLRLEERITRLESAHNKSNMIIMIDKEMRTNNG